MMKETSVGGDRHFSAFRTILVMVIRNGFVVDDDADDLVSSGPLSDFSSWVLLLLDNELGLRFRAEEGEISKQRKDVTRGSLDSVNMIVVRFLLFFCSFV
jgi:hypothetical protein